MLERQGSLYSGETRCAFRWVLMEKCFKLRVAASEALMGLKTGWNSNFLIKHAHTQSYRHQVQTFTKLEEIPSITLSFINMTWLKHFIDDKTLQLSLRVKCLVKCPKYQFHPHTQIIKDKNVKVLKWTTKC